MKNQFLPFIGKYFIMYIEGRSWYKKIIMYYYVKIIMSYHEA